MSDHRSSSLSRSSAPRRSAPGLARLLAPTLAPVLALGLIGGIAVPAAAQSLPGSSGSSGSSGNIGSVNELGGSVDPSSAGAGSATHMTSVLLNAAIGVDVTHVPYRGTGPAMRAM